MSTSTKGTDTPLRRGEACIPCRRRKIKCDGQKPICSQCIRFNRSDECEFKDGPAPSNARMLEQHIAQLEARIQELSNVDGNTIVLQNPYEPGAHSTGSTQPSSVQGGAPGLPVDILRGLFRLAVPFLGTFGFFLDLPRFQASVAAGPGSTQHSPVTLLRDVVCLLGMHISNDPAYTAHKQHLSNTVLNRVHSALSAAQDNYRTIMYALQAEVLLAYYFFDTNRLLEGKLHAGAAVSLAMMCRLHKVGSGLGRAAEGMLSDHQTWPPPPQDRVEERERIEGWWQTFILDKSWAVPLASPSMIEDRNGLDATIDTPWPRGGNDEDLGPALVDNGRTLQRFFENVLADINTSTLGLHAKAAALYEKANHMSSYLSRNLPNYHLAVTALDASIDCFIQSLPAARLVGSNYSEDDPDAHALLIAHTLAQCATIQLHRGLIGRNPVSMSKCLTSAYTVAGLTQHVDAASIRCVNPIMAVLWATAAEILVQGLRTLRTLHGTAARAPTVLSLDNDALVFSLNTLANVMGAFTPRSPLFDEQVTKLRTTLAGM